MMITIVCNNKKLISLAKQNQMYTTAFVPLTRNSFAVFLKRATSLSQLSQTHAQLLINGFQYDMANATKLIHRLFDYQATRHAHQVFLSVPSPDLFLFNVLIKGFSVNRSYISSILMFKHLRESTNLKPDNYTYAFAVSSVSIGGDERIGVLLHGQAVVDGFGSDLFIGSALVDLYLNVSAVKKALKVFDRMPVRDTVLWNTVISGLVKNCCFEDSVSVFGDMVTAGDTRLDSTTVSVVLSGVAELKDLRLGTKIQSLALKLGIQSQIQVLTGLISLYAKCECIETAWLLYRHIERPDLISCNAMISGFTFNGQTDSSLRLFRTLLYSGEKINSSTIVGLIPVHHPFGQLHLTKCIHCFCTKCGVVSHASVLTALTTVYSRVNEMECARKLFDESSKKTLASWNAMISGYTQNGLTDTAISLFREMQMSDVNPNPVTLTSILSACAQLGALSLGKWVHGLVKSESFKFNVYVTTALIDMYAKCGSIIQARQLFDLMPEKNEVTWNAMISGYGLHGHGDEALNIYSQMLHSGVRPTGVTFLSVLYACSHAGLVREGEELFHAMIHDYGFEPSSEHYACMVDILGRAGHLKRALEFIRRMAVEPGPAEWGSLLGACVVHKDMDLARIASTKLFELDPENVGYQVLLSNVYSTEGNYLQAALVRQTVKKRKLIKTPGCTLIEIGDTPHVFMAGDQSHPQTKEIYAMLEKLEGKMKEAGFQTDTVTALHDVEEEEKELMVKVHSEKLAIAFGLIVTPPGTEIRIIKNLRVCLDCHNATKFISKVTERIIVVRDANRFHHFKDGVCSCGDYW